MSLQVWLPLDGRLDNFGLADVTVTNNGATVDASGKIGKCYSFDGNAHYLQFSKTLGDIYTKDFSWVVWLNPSDDTRSVICSQWSSSGSSNVAFELSASRQIRIYWNGSPDLYGPIVPKNEWNHYVITRHNNVLIIYKNGEKVWENSSNTLSNRSSTACIRIGDDYRGGTSVSYMGKMNDFRIYDHCLSAKEVKEISKGLVRHYPLNEIIGKPNLLQSVPTYNNSTNYCAYVLKLSQNLEVNKTYTLQLWNVYNKNTASTSSIGVYWGGGYNNLKGITGFTSDNIYKNYIKITFTAAIHNSTTGQNQANNAWIQLYNMPSSTLEYMQIEKWKLEEGSEATPWVPNINDAKYSSYDLGNVVYDCSGYGRNGTLSSTPPTYGSQSPRYFNCMAFNGTNNYIDCGLSGDGNLPTDAITVCGWGYRDNWDQDKRIISCTQGGGFNFEGTMDRFVIYRNNEYIIASSSFSKITGWYFLVGTYDGYVAKCYINGQLKASSTVTSTKYPIIYNSSAKLFIGCEPSSASPSAPYWNGKISDIRIYCTALSAQDIKELYQSSLSVDNMGNFHTHEIFENTEAQS